MKNFDQLREIVLLYGKDILESEKMQAQKLNIQHSDYSVFEHSFFVAMVSVSMALRSKKKVNMEWLVRGALLHDYFLYDWHKKEKWHRLHGYKHARFALINASRDYNLNKVERDIIDKHMFPLNVRFPRYRESRIVCLADKYCAMKEIFSKKSYRGVKIKEALKF